MLPLRLGVGCVFSVQIILEFILHFLFIKEIMLIVFYRITLRYFYINNKALTESNLYIQFKDYFLYFDIDTYTDGNKSFG